MGLLDYLQSDPASMDHATLYRLREAVAENPLMAIPIGLAAPLYQASKLMPWSMSRSSPGLGQLGQAFAGIGEGLLSSIRGR